MNKKLIAAACIMSILFPAPLLARAEEKPQAGEDEGVGQAPRPMPQDERERRMRSADTLIMTGWVLAAVGGATAIAGSTILVAKSNKLLLGAIISGSGAAIGLAGGVMTMIGYHRRSRAGDMYYSLAPVLNPARNAYGLNFAMNF